MLTERKTLKHQEKWHMCVDKLFDLSKKDFDKHLSTKDYLFIQNQKGPRKSTFGGKNLKQVKKLKRQLSKKELIKKIKTSEAEQELLRKIVDISQHFSNTSRETSSLETSPSSLDFEDNLLSSRYKATPNFIELKISRRILESD